MASRIERIEKELAKVKAQLRKMTTPPRGRKTIVASVSIDPVLKRNAARLLGGGNFSRAVVWALEQALRNEE